MLKAHAHEERKKAMVLKYVECKVLRVSPCTVHYAVVP